MLIALHAAYMFQIPRAGDNTGRALATFLDLAGFLAWCGIAQFFLQFVVPAEWVFPIENFLPAAFRVELFNSQGPLSYGSSIYRANGVFLLEPSFFSQLLAVAIVTELCTRNRLSRFPLYGLALLVSYSGTGLMVLALCLPLMVILWQRWDLLLVGALALLLLMAFGEALNLDLFAKRANEFGATGSSAFARFVGASICSTSSSGTTPGAPCSASDPALTSSTPPRPCIRPRKCPCSKWSWSSDWWGRRFISASFTTACSPRPRRPGAPRHRHDLLAQRQLRALHARLGAQPVGLDQPRGAGTRGTRPQHGFRPFLGTTMVTSLWVAGVLLLLLSAHPFITYPLSLVLIRRFRRPEPLRPIRSRPRALYGVRLRL